jgi:hypothetical protein
MIWHWKNTLQKCESGRGGDASGLSRLRARPGEGDSMKWFGRKAGRAAARPALTRGFGLAFGPGEWPRSYEAQVREAYALNPIAQRAVRLVAESVGSAPILCSEPDVARLVAAQSGGQGLLETVAAHMLLHGTRRRASTVWA